MRVREAPFSRYNNVARRTDQATNRSSFDEFTSPELEGLKHTRARSVSARRRKRGIARSVGQVPKTPESEMGTQIQPFTPQPTGVYEGEGDIDRGYTEGTAPEWGTEDYQKGMYNLAREQIGGQTAADVEYARTELGGRGFRAGESGIANRALMDIRRGGSERLGTESRKMAMQGMGARYGQQQDLMRMIMDKYGMDIQAQQGRFNPYWNVEQQYAGSA